MDNQAITEAVHAAVAKSILEGLDTEARDALLQKSIADTIGSYSFRSAVEAVVAEKAKRVVAELVESEEWEEAIRETIRDGLEGYLANLRQAIPGFLKECLHGNDQGTYSRSPSRILHCWPKEDES